MFYDFAVAIPANTAVTSPKEVTVRLTRGVIDRLEIEFPAGCAGLAHLVINDNGHQVWPTNSEGSFASDNHIVAFDEQYDLIRSPYNLRLIGWNEDDTYQHTIVVRIGIRLIPSPVLREEGLSMWQKLAKLIPGG